MKKRTFLTIALAVLLAAALALAGCQGGEPASPPPAEENTSAAPEGSSQPNEPTEPVSSTPEPPAESSSQTEETPEEPGSTPEAPPESASEPPSPESSSAAGGASSGYGQPEGMPPAEALPDNPLPPPAVNGVYDRPDRVYSDGYVAPNDQNNPYHFDFSSSESFYGVPVDGWIDEHAFVWGKDGLYWWPFMDSGTNRGGSINDA